MATRKEFFVFQIVDCSPLQLAKNISALKQNNSEKVFHKFNSDDEFPKQTGRLISTNSFSAAVHAAR